jgi:hypothetical protein
MSNDLAVRDDKGRFIPGQSGNPGGRQKGLKNYITHERLMLESALRDYVGKPDQARKLLQGIDRVLNIAIEGDDKASISAMKLLLDRVMPAMPAKEQEDTEKVDRRLEIIIRTNPNAASPVHAVVDGEFTEIEEPEMSDMKANQSTDAKQGGEGTNSFDGKSYDAMTVSVGEKVGQGNAPMPPKDEGTK